MMTPEIQQVAAEIASRIQAMAKDSATNNAAVIAGLLEQRTIPLAPHPDSNKLIVDLANRFVPTTETITDPLIGRLALVAARILCERPGENPAPDELLKLKEGVKAAQDFIEWLWELDEMGYIVGEGDWAECGQCRGEGLRTDTYAIKHEEDCVQGKIVALKARLERIMEGRE